ncbi:hypothetical protein CDAR_275591 [Caerostris darwini]|uniref:Uncharacterized protein n=1 Tax=Caerostris darwini TaxID=1538125 RepID=A0AAV4UNQ8_9ARAC|nr:hypothetical protein CDAR_275591 [Caerostris darwini]
MPAERANQEDPSTCGRGPPGRGRHFHHSSKRKQFEEFAFAMRAVSTRLLRFVFDPISQAALIHGIHNGKVSTCSRLEGYANASSSVQSVLMFCNGRRNICETNRF